MFKETFSIFKNIFQNKKLLLQFSFNDFKAKYAGSALGIVWAFLTPLVTVLTYWFVFSVGLRSRAGDNMPFIVYLVTGMVPWFFFSDSLLSATNVFREYSYLVKKVVFNVQILPTSKILSNLYTHLFFILIGFVIINIIMQTVMWTLPILWQPTGMIATILKINPLYYIVQGYRESYLGGAWFWEHWQYSLYFWGVTIVLLLIGSTVFRRLKPHFSDVL